MTALGPFLCKLDLGVKSDGSEGANQMGMYGVAPVSEKEEGEGEGAERGNTCGDEGKWVTL